MLARSEQVWPFVSLGADATPLTQALASASARLRSWAAQVATIGAAVGAAGGAMLAPITQAFRGAVERGADMAGLADQLGATTEEVSRLSYAFSTVGIGADSISHFMRHLNHEMASAADGNADAIQSFAQLGLTWQQLQAMPLAERLAAVGDAVSRMGQQFDKSNQAQKFFGRSGQEMLRLFAGGGDKLRKAMSEADDVGATVTTEMAGQARTISRAYATMTQTLHYAFLSIGEALLPQADSIKEFATLVVGASKGVREWVGKNKELVLQVAGWGAALSAAGTAMVALAGVVTAGSLVLSAAAGIVGTAWTIVTFPIGIAWAAMVASIKALMLAKTVVVTAAYATMAVGAQAAAASALSAWVAALGPLNLIGVAALAVAGTLGYLYATQTREGRQAGETIRNDFAGAFHILADEGKSAWATLKDAALSSWGGITTALKRGDLESAGRIAWAGLNVVFAQGMLSLKNLWDQMGEYLTDAWHGVTNELANIFGRMVAGWQILLSEAIQSVLRGMAQAHRAMGQESSARLIEGMAVGIGATTGTPETIVRQQQETEARRDRERSTARDERATERAGAPNPFADLLREAKRTLALLLKRETDKAKATPTAKGADDEKPNVGSVVAAAREARGSFGSGFSTGAIITQVFAAGNSPAQRALIVAEQQLTELKGIRKEVGAGVE